MGARHEGREAALQMLFQIEASGVRADEAILLFWRSFEAEPEGREYADAACGASRRARPLDATHHERVGALASRAHGPGRPQRPPPRDLGAVAPPGRPRAVILDEAVELAKEFGTEESGAFVNGVLNRIADDLGRNDAPP